MALDQYLADEVVLDCADGILSRREALRRLVLLGVSAPAAAALLAACSGYDDDDGGDAAATSVPDAATGGTTGPTAAPTSPASPTTGQGAGTTAEPTATTAGSGASAAEEIRFPGPQGELIGAWSSPAGPKGAVLVIHESRGLTPHIRSIPPRLAADGYAALAIDLLSEEGGTASMPSEDDATAALGQASSERLVTDLRAGLDELEQRVPGAKLAVIGFCFGGGMTWQLLAAGDPRISAAVPFYGPAPADADFSGSPDAAVFGIYAEEDDRVNASREAAGAALTAAGLTHELRTFPGVDHAFFNDTGPRYDEAAATEAYRAMLDWFASHLA
jgi:carboxymethylenebutenolidase